MVEELGIAFLVATLLGLVTHRVGQPIILGYFVAGVILGPEIWPAIIHDAKSIEMLSEIGLILLLFIIGLEMNLPKILGAGRQLLVAGVGQFLLCALFGLALFGALGYGLRGARLDGFYLAVLCALSSTAIVVKLLYDKFELDTYPGRITLGVLVFQDLWAVLFLAFQPDLRHPDVALFAVALLKCLVLVGLSFLVGKYLLARVFRSIARSPELILATSLGWCALVAAAAQSLGLSMEMGALVAGVVIASFPYSVYVTAKVLPLRDFFLTLFFVSLGMKIPYPTAAILGSALGLGAFVLVSRFLSVYPLLLASGAGQRTAFISSLNLSQMSEFSLVIAALGVTFGHIDENLMGIFIYTMAVTAIASSYLIQYSHQIFTRVARIGRLGRMDEARIGAGAKAHGGHGIVLLGFHHGARALLAAIQDRMPRLQPELLVVDFNLETLREVRRQEIATMYGDISHVDLLEHAGVASARVVISTVPDMLLKGTSNERIVRICRSLSPESFIIATAETPAQAERLVRAGADEAVLPHALTAERICAAMEMEAVGCAGDEAG